MENVNKQLEDHELRIRKLEEGIKGDMERFTALESSLKNMEKAIEKISNNMVRMNDKYDKVIDMYYKAEVEREQLSGSGYEKFFWLIVGAATSGIVGFVISNMLK